ncbi:MAG: glycosyltransferase family 39 protein [bacterium]|nr:glycosyltransferase family 39 protein [bacterium]
MNKRWIIILIIIATAAFFRFYNLADAPPGLYPDEAMNGNNALQAISTGDYKVFYPENNGREGLFMNLQAISISAFGNEPWALRLVSAIFGTLTVLGLYLLTKELFNRHIAYIASFLLAVSFWHVLFSRISFRAIMAPMFLVFALYFLWQALRSKHLLPFAISGLFWGLGLYSYLAFRIIPLAAIITLLAYWHFIKKDYDHEKYERVKMDIARGLVLALFVAALVSIPLALYFYNNPGDFLGRTGQLSIFASENPALTLIKNLGQTLAMFNFEGDRNWRHNLGGSPMLLWPVGAMFVVGFLRSIFKCLRQWKRHGHFSTVQTLLLSWFFVGLLPVILSSEGIPHALRAIIIVPVVYIFAAEGIWWLYEVMSREYRSTDVHEIKLRRLKISESNIVAGFAIIVFLGAIAIANFDKYFNKWAQSPITAAYFNKNYVDLGKHINNLPIEVKKYVLVNAGGVLVNGIPMPSQTVMFITDTYTPEKQKAKNIFYLTEEQFVKTRIERDALVLPLEQR